MADFIMNVRSSAACGFTLVEMALVLLILGVLTRAAIVPFAAAQKHQQFRQVQQQLDAIKHAIWGHVIANGRLPCPLVNHGGQSDAIATAAITRYPDLSSTSSDKDCAQSHGAVPARSLGLPGPISDDGALLDPWNRPYRLAVTLADHGVRGIPGLPDWMDASEASRVGVAALQADLALCLHSVGGRCPGNATRADQLAFVVLSTGADSSAQGDQTENMDADNVFVLQAESSNAAVGFDDQLAWGTAAETLYWMLRAGWLP